MTYDQILYYVFATCGVITGMAVCIFITAGLFSSYGTCTMPKDKLAAALQFPRQRPRQEVINRLMVTTGWNEQQAIEWLTRPLTTKKGNPK